MKKFQLSKFYGNSVEEKKDILSIYKSRVNILLWKFWYMI